MHPVPIGVTARNEAANILTLLDSLRVSTARATAALDTRFEIHVLLNDNEDDTPDLLSDQPGITVWHTHGGLVEAQRTLIKARPSAPFVIFTDADILIHPDTITELATALQNPTIQIAYAEKYPVQPIRHTLLAKALYLYNLREGYQNRRAYCNGQCFAIRSWNIPTPDDLTWNRAADSPFLNLSAGIRADDIFLSRDLLSRGGPEAFQCTPAGIRYRPPETLRGMFRKYQRMRLEIERLNHFFPGTPTYGRKPDRTALSQAPLNEKLYYALFQSALTLCKLAYHAQRLYYTHISKTPCPTWLPVTETKQPCSSITTQI